MKEEYFRVSVETYDGHKGAERPIAFTWKEHRIACERILDRWYGQDHEYFKVEGNDGRTYILRYGRSDDAWELTVIQKNEQT